MTTGRPTIIHYCQHVIGVRHYFRSVELARSLDWARVVMVSGGREVPAELPPHVELFRLPGLAMPHHEGCLVPVEQGSSLGEVQQRRARMLENLVRELRPELMLVELFPFGRRLFRFELVPMIERGRKIRPDSLKVVCSLRDAVEPKFNDRKIARQTLGLLNHYFDALLVPCNKILWNRRNSKPRAGVPCLGCTQPEFPQPYPFFQTRNIADIPLELPEGVDRAHYLAYKGMAAAAAPQRLIARKSRV